MFSAFGDFFSVFCSHGLSFRTIFVLRGGSASLMPLVRKSTFRIFRKSKILSEEIFAQITDRDCIPPDRLFSSRTTSSKSAPRSALHGRKFCSRIPQRQSRLLIFPRDFLSSYLGKSVSFRERFSSRGYLCNPPPAYIFTDYHFRSLKN